MAESFQEMIARIAADNLKALQKDELDQYGRVLSPEERKALWQEQKAREQADMDAAEKAEQERRRQAWIKGRMDSVPLRYRESTLDSYQNEALKGSESWSMLLKGSSGIIYGDFGCGKTHLGWGLCKLRWGRGIDASLVSASQIFKEIKAQFGNGGDSDKVIAKYQALPYLVIDEADKSYGTQLEYVNLFDIINARYNECLPTVILINAESAADIPGLIGGANFDRIGNGGVVIHLTQKSMRGSQGKISREGVF